MTVELPTDLGEEAAIPSSWAYFSDSTGRVAVFAASSSEKALETFQSEENGFQRIDEEDVEPGDAYVEVWVTYPPGSSDKGSRDALPSNISESSFEANGSLHDATLFELTGQGENDGLYSIRYWVGPEADSTSVAETRNIIASLEVGEQPGR